MRSKETNYLLDQYFSDPVVWSREGQAKARHCISSHPEKPCSVH